MNVDAENEFFPNTSKKWSQDKTRHSIKPIHYLFRSESKIENACVFIYFILLKKYIQKNARRNPAEI